MIKCHDCGAKEGELHMDGCDMEKCPNCKGQLISCGCEDKDIINKPKEPYFGVPFFCKYCGKIMPDMFQVSNEEWKRICGATFPLDCILCRKCFDKIKRLRENG